jgi:hypothetical protein
MNNLKISNAGEMNNGIYADTIPSDLETELQLKLEKTKEFRANYRKIKTPRKKNISVRRY